MKWSRSMYFATGSPEYASLKNFCFPVFSLHRLKIGGKVNLTWYRMGLHNP